MTKNQETRKMAVDMEIRKADLDAQDENLTVTGYAVVFNKPAVMWHDPYDDTNYYEVIDEKALDEADLSDVVMRYNHNDSSEILARTSNQTLNLIKDDSGLKIIAQLANTSFGRDVYELIKRKDISQMQEIVERQTGHKTNLMRFAGGSSNSISANYTPGIMTLLTEQAPQKGFQYFDWNISSGDGGTEGSSRMVHKSEIFKSIAE